jgi:hypothetical protein
MQQTQLTVTLELDLADESLSGRVIDADGAERPFSGWMGLVGVLDNLLAPPEENKNADH